MFLLEIWNMIQVFMLWGSIAAAAGALLYGIHSIIKKNISAKLFLIMAVSSFYLGLLVYMGFEYFSSSFGVLLIIVFVISVQLQKYEDRRAGRRWWER